MKLLEKIKAFVSTMGEKLKKIDFKKPVEKFSRLKKPIKIAICAVLVLAIGLGVLGINKIRTAKKASSEATAGTSIVMQGSVIDSITGSGTVEPIEQREIVPLVNGKIIESPFEEGDEVLENDVLYRFEMTAAENAIKTAENNVEKARTNLSNRSSNITKVQENIAALTIKAAASGKVSDLSLKVGEEVSGKVCTITNYKEQTATIPFGTAQIDSIKVGDSATVAIDKYMINVQGKVVRKYSAPETLSSGGIAYNVEIRLSGDDIIEENINVTATVHTSSGDVNSASYGSVKYADPVTVNAEQRGKVSKVNVKSGDWVNKGEVIAVLKNSDLTDELKTAHQNLTDAQMSLSEAESNLEDRVEAAQDYILTSPINGTILTKDYTVGDTVGGQNATTMMVIADMSKMKFTISVDELDISKISLGQSVQVTADALENQRLQGKITSVSKLGTASNGVTTYPIEVTIDEPGDLMPGMNVSAQIIVERADNCLYLPVSAVEYFGGKYYVTVVGEVENMPEMPQRMEINEEKENGKKSDSEEKENAPQSSANGEKAQGDKNIKERNFGAMNGQMPERPQGEMPERPQGEMPERPQGEMPQRPQGEMPQRPQGEMPQRPQGEMPQRPQGEMPERPQDETAKPSEKGNTESTQKESADAKTEKSEKPQESNKSAQGNSQMNFPKNGEMPQRTKQSEMKIKLSGKEERIEVQVGISNDEYYEIKSGVTLGQVVKNTSQQTGSTGNTMGRMPGMMGGMPGGMSGGMMGGGMPRNMGGMSGGMGAKR